jgi:hypothetical protein
VPVARRSPLLVPFPLAEAGMRYRVMGARRDRGGNARDHPAATATATATARRLATATTAAAAMAATAMDTATTTGTTAATTTAEAEWLRHRGRDAHWYPGRGRHHRRVDWRGTDNNADHRGHSREPGVSASDDGCAAQDEASCAGAMANLNSPSSRFGAVVRRVGRKWRLITLATKHRPCSPQISTFTIHRAAALKPIRARQAISYFWPS